MAKKPKQILTDKGKVESDLKPIVYKDFYKFKEAFKYTCIYFERPS